MSEENDKKSTKIRIEKDTDEIPVEDIREILGVVNKELPTLIRGLFSSLYDVNTAEQYAKGIAMIYKTLSEQGLPNDMVDKLVMRYADSINILGNAMSKLNFDSKNRDEDD